MRVVIGSDHAGFPLKQPLLAHLREQGHVVADVGSLRDDVVEGRTGFVFRPRDPVDLARALEGYFGSKLFEEFSDDPIGSAGRRQQFHRVATLRKDRPQLPRRHHYRRHRSIDPISVHRT